MTMRGRGDGPLVVWGMGFRWGSEPGQPVRVVVRHELDAGRLTLVLPVDGGEVLPSPVARAVELALEGGWKTDEHEVFELSSAEWEGCQMGRSGATSGERRLELPRLQGQGMGALRVLYQPLGGREVVIRLWRDVGAGLCLERGGDGRGREISVEPEGVEDLLVLVRATLPRRALPGRARLSGRVELRDSRGAWEAVTELDRARGRSREAAVGLWRLAMEAFVEDGEAMGILQTLHGDLQPQDLPFLIDPPQRLLQVFGRWEATELATSLAEVEGPWVVDGRRLVSVTGESRLLNRFLNRYRTRFVWLGEEQHLHGEVSPGIRWAADRAEAHRCLREGAQELLEEVLLGTMEPGWVVRAGELLTDPRSELREQAFEEIEGWLDGLWRPWQGGEVQGWRFVEELEGWCPGLPDRGLVLSRDRFWVVTSEGRVFSREGRRLRRHSETAEGRA